MVVVNDIIGLIRDSSGNGNDATQSTAASKPKLQQDANGYCYLEFDGIDDTLFQGNLVHGDASTHIVVVEKLTADADLSRILSSGSADPSNISLKIGSTGFIQFSFGNYTTGSGTLITPSGVIAGTSRNVIAAVRDYTNNVMQIWVNGNMVAEGTHDQAGRTMDRYIGSRQIQVFTAMKLFGVVEVLDRALTESEIVKTTQLLATKCGVSL